MHNILPSFIRTYHTVFYILFIVFVSSCGDNSDDMFDCSGVTPTYTADIKPILDTSCAKSGCHDSITMQNGVNLSSYATASVISQQER
ncbi:MAG TPA: hypothetical protein VMZ69_05715, partial [Saprospiraceae bacterium]|nr:hypothetical protein [Saprospiraceae bacterium]